MFADAGSKQNTDPLLAALANNGGETDTWALLAGSPAIDAGSNDGCPPSDQRGFARPAGHRLRHWRLRDRSETAGAGAGRSEPEGEAEAPEGGSQTRFPDHGGEWRALRSDRGDRQGHCPGPGQEVTGPKVGEKKPCKLAKAKKGKRKLTCRLAGVAAGKAKRLKVVVRPKHAGKLRVRARVRSGVADPNLKNNKAKASTKVAVPLARERLAGWDEMTDCRAGDARRGC
jgi:hypothetical protein